MDMVHENDFVVFIRADRPHQWEPQRVERPVATCNTYEEARRIQQACRHSLNQECVIRYNGIAGGGD
jgi:hypothetical protein